jgi:hypothetical protein
MWLGAGSWELGAWSQVLRLVRSRVSLMAVGKNFPSMRFSGGTLG